MVFSRLFSNTQNRVSGSVTYKAFKLQIMKNNENVGGAYRRHEGEGDEEHESLKAGLKKAEGMLAQVGSLTQ